MLLAGAQSVDTDWLLVPTNGDKVLAGTPAVHNLKSLRLQPSRGYHRITGLAQTLDLTHLKKLQTLHLANMPGVYKVDLPPSITDVAMPITTIGEFSNLKSLVKLQLAACDWQEMCRIDLVWPPALTHLDLSFNGDAVCVPSLTASIPASIVHLGYVGEPINAPMIETSIPPQCVALEILFFSRARFGHIPIENATLPPSTLKLLDIYSLRLSDASAVDNLIDFLPTHTQFKLGSIRQHNGYDLPSASVPQTLKLMDRLDAESVEMQIFRYNGLLPVVDDDHRQSLKQFKQGSERILAKHGLTHKNYFDDLLHTTITTIAEVVSRLPQPVAARILSVTKAFYGGEIKMPGLVNDVSDENMNSTRYLFEQGLMTGFSIWKITDLPFDSAALLSDFCISQRIERLCVDADEAWFSDLFPPGVHFPRLRRITVERVNNAASIPTIYAARHALPLLERVDLSAGSVLNNVAHVKMMADLRLYGSTKVTCYPTVMRYYVSPPPFFAHQLKGTFEQIVVVDPVPVQDL